MSADKSGSFLYVPNTVSNDVSAYSINSMTGALTPMPGSPFPAGQVPLSIELDRSEKFVYVTNSGSNNVSVYAINGMNGQLQAVQTMATPGSAVSVALTGSE